MKNLVKLLLTIGLFLISSCQQSNDLEITNRKAIENERDTKQNMPDLPHSLMPKNGISSGSPENLTFQFGYACYEVKTFQIVVGPSQRNSGVLTLPSDYVIIGGGAIVTNVSSSSNLPVSSFITASRPDFANNSWIGQSKDHLNPELHRLTIYAIGLRPLTMTSSQLRANMSVFTNTSSVLSHPQTSVTVPANYTMLGGGAQINYGSGAGNLLVHSYPSSLNTWSVRGKDHRFASPSTITAYAIGINNVLGFTSSIIETPSPTFVNVGISFNTFSNPTDWYPGCPGARTTFNGYGRMLLGYYIDDEFFTTFSSAKDLNWASSGFLSSYLLVFRPPDCR